MGIKSLARTKKIKVQPNWTEVVTQLTTQIKQWAQEQGWTVTVGMVEEIDSRMVYEFPPQWTEFSITTPKGELRLELMGIVRGEMMSLKLTAWPTLYRVRLMNDGQSENWVVWTDSGIPLHQPWNKETFLTLANDLLAAL